MAIQSFYISVVISKEDKCAVKLKTNFQKYKKSADLIYRDVLYIDDITEKENFWHINVGLYDFFHNCEVLYDFCQTIATIKPNFTFCLLGQEYTFAFSSLLDFVSFIYPKVEIYKKQFEQSYGVLSIHPQKFFLFRRKNKRFFK